MRILLTGGAGYVGSACLRHLLAQGSDVYAFDDLSQGHAEAVPEERLRRGDILDTSALTKALRETRAEAVMHFAAATCVGESVENPEHYYRTNIGGTRSVLAAMRAASVRRILFSSTCATYGLSPTVPMTEDTPQNPCSPYARTKLAVEWMIEDFARAYGLGFTLLRYFNAAGASPDGKYGEDHDPENHLIPLILQVMNGQREKLQVFGDDYPTPDGTCIRDYVHVDDLAEAHQLAIQSTEPGAGRVYNVGTGTGSSVMEVIRACEAVTGRAVLIGITGRRPGDPPTLVADPRNVMKELGWHPRYGNIQEIVQTAWRWHEAHPDGYRSEAPAAVR